MRSGFGLGWEGFWVETWFFFGDGWGFWVCGLGVRGGEG